MAKTGVSNDGEFCRMEGNVEGRPSCLRLRDFGCGQGWQGSPEQGNWLCHVLLYPAPLESLRASLRIEQLEYTSPQCWNALLASRKGLVEV